MPIRLKKQVIPDVELLSNKVCLEWHVWERQLQPYQDLESGDHVIMVSGEPDSGMLTWEVEVVLVARDRCDDVDSAWRLLEPLATQAEVTEDDFRADPFTDRLTQGRRYVLGWIYRPVREIMQPRIRGEHDLPRHGWKTVDVLRIGSSGDSARGQQQLQDAVLRGKVEAAAMELVLASLIHDGWELEDIRDTSANKPYDYEIGPENDPYLRVEVKGTQNSPGDVFVTAGEVNSALNGGVRTILAIVHDLEVTLEPDGSWQVAGGQLWRDDDWKPEPTRLTPTQYRYTPDFG